ncbi:Mitochondrial import receptor subunit TOM9-2 [Dionaea muscipula]
MAARGSRKKSTMTSGSDDRSGGVLGDVSSVVSGSPIVYRGRKAACDAVYAAKKLLRSTGKAAWIAGTTFLILVVPLIVEMDREQYLNELDLQQASLLGTPPIATGPPLN